MACGILVPKQGMNPGPHPGSTVLTTGLPGKPLCGHFKSSGICSPIYHLPLYTVSGLNVFRAVRPPPRVSGKEPMSPEPRDPWLIGLHSAASHPGDAHREAHGLRPQLEAQLRQQTATLRTDSRVGSCPAWCLHGPTEPHPANTAPVPSMTPQHQLAPPKVL